ncbi:MAG: hypothetical protein ACRDTC_11770 [Pseudonocardiaceae bacterium]
MDNRARGASDRAFENDMVQELLSRTEGSRYRTGRRPVLVFTGGAATGKTSLVTEIAKGGRGRFPVAFLDLEVVEPVLGEHPVPGLLAAVARQLTERSKRYGSLRFDRLVIGLLAIEADLTPPDRRTREDRVLEILKARRGVPTLKQVLGEAAKEVLAQVPDPGLSSSALGTMAVATAVDTAVAWRLTRRRVLGRYQAWFGDQDEGRRLDPVDVLMGLNSAYRPGARPAEAQEADYLLWRAFLADLRDNFRRARHAEDWTWSALLLLDGADTALGQDFLHRLVQSLDPDTALRSGLETPLTVVVASRGGVFEQLTKVQTKAVRWVAGLADIPSASTDPGVVWLARRLPSFTVGQVYDIVCGSGLPRGDARNLTTMLYQLAGGHPGGTQDLLRALAGDGVALVDPEELLTANGDPPLGERILARLLAGFPEDAIEHLTLASAGRTEEEGRRLLAWSDGSRVPVPEGMWDATTPTSLLRMLLLRRLASDSAGWLKAYHEGLRIARAEQDLSGELHHLMALDQADEVVKRLADQLKLHRRQVMHWLSLLDAAACAPIRDRTAPPAPSTAVEPFVRTLLVDTHRVSDPLCGPDRHRPYFRVANAYRDLARHLADSGDAEGMAEVDERIDRFDALARQWRRLTPRPN